MCALRAQSAVELEPDMQHITLASHTSLALAHALICSYMLNICILRFSTIVKASVILLPLLGVTWVLGLFAVNQNTLLFAWLFTIFNSLQVRTIVVSLELKGQQGSEIMLM